jgi:hypothetical protein
VKGLDERREETMVGWIERLVGTGRPWAVPVVWWAGAQLVALILVLDKALGSRMLLRGLALIGFLLSGGLVPAVRGWEGTQ